MNELIIENINQGEIYEKPYINWSSFVIFSILSFGIFGLYYFIKRVNRVNFLINRKKELGKLFVQKYNRYNLNYYNSIETINPYLSILLIFLTLGIYFYIYIYKFNNIWQVIDNCEENFYRDFCQLSGKSINFQPIEKSNYFYNLLLSFITFGIWFLVWDYKIHNKAGKFFYLVHNREKILESRY